MAQLSDDCFAFGGPMMPVDEATAIIASRITPVAELEVADLAHADGRVLAEDLVAPLPLPPFTNSAVDGYAVHSRDLPMSGNGQACNMCHADGSVTHPETYPKYKPQIGQVATIQQMMGWCIAIPNQGKPYALGSKEMNALEAYMNWNNRGQVLEIGAAPSNS